jgi:two-component sensor histidine kinase
MPNHRSLVRPLLIFGVATALGFFSAFQAYYFVNTFTEKPTSFVLLLGLNLGYWYSWACLAPTILWLSRRFTFDRHVWKQAVPVHVVGVFVATLAHVAMTVAWSQAVYAAMGDQPSPWLAHAQRMFFLNFDWEMMTYWAVVGLSHALNYYRESQARALRAAQLETRLVEAQLQALQRQLQPHFLFNTLNTISALMHRDVDAADATIARLSDLLRISLQTTGVQEVELKQELDFLSKYLEIEQTRFRDRLTARFDIAPETLGMFVPNLLLQPLVENSIKHGIAPRSGPGTITIRSCYRAGSLELHVQDDGRGMSEARLSAFNHGVGLANTRSRLERLYGLEHRFEFRQPPGGGLLVLIGIPVAEVPVAVGATEAIEGAA